MQQVQQAQGKPSLLDEPEEHFLECHDVTSKKLGNMHIAKGDWEYIPAQVRKFVSFWVSTFE